MLRYCRLARPESLHSVGQRARRFQPSRAQANSDALSDFVVADFRNSCNLLGSALSSGELKPGKNPSVHTKVAERSIDLVIYENNDLPAISVRVSVEHKTIMTARGKARKNRYGDIIAYLEPHAQPPAGLHCGSHRGHQYLAQVRES